MRHIRPSRCVTRSPPTATLLNLGSSDRCRSGRGGGCLLACRSRGLGALLDLGDLLDRGVEPDAHRAVRLDGALPLLRVVEQRLGLGSGLGLGLGLGGHGLHGGEQPSATHSTPLPLTLAPTLPHPGRPAQTDAEGGSEGDATGLLRRRAAVLLPGRCRVPNDVGGVPSWQGGRRRVGAACRPLTSDNLIYRVSRTDLKYIHHNSLI